MKLLLFAALAYQRRLGPWARRLLKELVDKLIAEARQECAGKANAQAVEKALGHFVNNVARVQERPNNHAARHDSLALAA
jgi:hypothetical protein